MGLKLTGLSRHLFILQNRPINNCMFPNDNLEVWKSKNVLLILSKMDNFKYAKKKQTLTSWNNIFTWNIWCSLDTWCSLYFKEITENWSSDFQCHVWWMFSENVKKGMHIMQLCVLGSLNLIQNLYLKIVIGYSISGLEIIYLIN